jgi:hypothetical protein
MAVGIILMFGSGSVEACSTWDVGVGYAGGRDLCYSKRAMGATPCRGCPSSRGGKMIGGDGRSEG